MDRRWMLVDSENSFLSQRQIPALTRLIPSFKEELKIQNLDDSVIVTAAINEFAESENVEVWGQIVEARKAPDKVNSWLTEQLRQPVKLFYMGEDNLRPIRGGNEGEVVSFADGYPILLTGSASLADLNKRLTHPVGIDRFRPNIHITTNHPFEEEAWQRIRIGEVTFRIVKKCARCTVINVDQDSGQVMMEPLKTLSTYRKEGNKVNFGMNLIPENNGLVHEGDSIEILS